MSIDKQSSLEYEFGNTRSGDSSDGAPSFREQTQNQRIVMMYDDNGNAIPMPMGNFYYDTYQVPEEETSEDDDFKHASDTECANKPAAFNMKPEDESGSEESFTEEGKEESDDDDQFMRIQVAAAPLKAVDRVEHDADHDKPSKAKSFQGVKRALSVKVPHVSMSTSDSDAERKRGVDRGGAPLTAKEKAAQARAAAKSNATGRSGVAAMGRMMSFSKKPGGGGHSSTSASEKLAVGDLGTTSPDTLGQDRVRSKILGSAPQRVQKRQGLIAVGRMLSLRKRDDKKESNVGKDDTSEDADAPVLSEFATSLGERRSEPSAQFQQRAREVTANRGKGSGAANSRHNLQQVGRVMSMSKVAKDNQDNGEGQFTTDDRERRETEKYGSASGARTGVKQVGRLLSMSKGPSTAQSAGLGSESAASQREVPSQDRAPTSNAATNVATAKREPRTGLKTAGRLLSFSRKPVTDDRGKARPEKSTGSSDSGTKPTAPNMRISPPSSSPRLDGRANKFFFSEISSAAIKASGPLASDSHIRVPVLVMAEYSGPVSKNKWFIDAFTLPHNAFRQECIDLYDILMALARCRADADICRDDMKDFHSWWTIAENFFKCYFDMEREVLFPWVDTAGSKDWELQMALNKMRSMKDGLQDQLDDVNKAWADLETAPPGIVFGSVYKAIDIFCPRVMNYFSDQELLLPQIVRGFYRIEDRLAMDKDMLAVFMGDPLTRKSRDLPHHNLVLLVRWIANPRQLRAWIAKYLNSSGRAAYSKWHASYEAEHSRLVKSFRNRSRASTIAAMAQS